MDKHTVAEVYYKNGYEKGFQDGIKKFARRLKFEYAYLNDGVNGFRDLIIEVDDIDNLLQELTKTKQCETCIYYDEDIDNQPCCSCVDFVNYEKGGVDE